MPLERRPKQLLLPGCHVDNYTTHGVDYVPHPFARKAARDCCLDPRHPAEHAHTFNTGTLRATIRPCSTCTQHPVVLSNPPRQRH